MVLRSLERAEETIMGPTETKAKRVDIMGGLSWEALKQVVRKDDIDRSSDKHDRDNTTREISCIKIGTIEMNIANHHVKDSDSKVRDQ